MPYIKYMYRDSIKRYPGVKIYPYLKAWKRGAAVIWVNWDGAEDPKDSRWHRTTPPLPGTGTWICENCDPPCESNTELTECPWAPGKLLGAALFCPAHEL